jgi:hypothetical protein
MHAAATRFLNDAVMRNGLADHLGDSRVSGRFILTHPQINE